MKITQLSEHIYRLGTFFIIPFNVWVVVEDDGVTLVDTGIPTMAKGILKFIDGLGKGKLKKILLTHGHSDHVGSVQAILADRKVPVFVHATEKPYMEGDIAYPGRKPTVMLPKGIAVPLEVKGETILPTDSLQGFFTPGHSPGHVVYYHEKDGILLAGDLFWEKKGRLRLPNFTHDVPRVVESAAIVQKLRPKSLEVCHGYTVVNPADQFDDYLALYRASKFFKP